MKKALLIGFRGVLIFDISRSDGTSRKSMHIQRFNSLVCKQLVSLEDELGSTFVCYKDNLEEAKSN